MSRYPRLRNLLRRLLVIGLSVMIGLGLLELAARVLMQDEGMNYGLEMWKYARDLKRPSTLPGVGHEHVPGAEATLMGVHVSINPSGYRDRNRLQRKPEGVYRILVLGDSMTFGWGVSAEDTYPARLERTLNEQGRGSPKFEVVNCGVGNYNACQSIAAFMHRGREWQPDLLVLSLFINDAEPTPEASGNVITRNSYLYALAASAYEKVGTRLGLRPDWKDYYRRLYEDDQTGWQACQRSVHELADYCGRTGLECLVFLIPEFHDPAGQEALLAPYRKLRTLAEEAGLSVLDPRRAFEGVSPQDLWVSRGDAHPNASGHATLAASLYEVLSEQSPWEKHRGAKTGAGR